MGIYYFGTQQIINPMSEVTKPYSQCLSVVVDYYKVCSCSANTFSDNQLAFTL